MDSEIQNRDRDLIWHPYTQMKDAAPFIPMVRGEGSYLFDENGNQYIDAVSSWWTNIHGHAHPHIAEAIYRQAQKMEQVIFAGFTHPAAVHLAEMLLQRIPFHQKVFYSDNGSGAVEIALKLSFQYWQLNNQPAKQHVVGLTHSYHGDTFGTMAVGDSGFFHDRFRPWCFKTTHIPSPLCEEVNGKVLKEDTIASLTALENLLKEKHSEIACVILEPLVQGAAGMKLLPKGYTASVSKLCKTYNVHLICDEVFVGFGRVGSLIVSTDEKADPDFICLAKGLTAGYIPLAATLVRENIYQAFLGTYESGKAFFHGHTFTGNPLGCAVALENIRKLEVLMSSGILKAKMDYFGNVFETAFSNHPKITGIRQRGFTAALDLDSNAKRKTHDPYHDLRLGLRVCLEARSRGLLLRPLGNSLLLVPPLCLSEDELSFLIQTTRDSINAILP